VIDATDLSTLSVLNGMSTAQLEKLAALGTEVRFEAGDVLFREGDPAEYWWLFLDGEIDAIRRVGHEEVVAGTMGEPGQWAGGFLAWTDDAGYMATARATKAGRFFRVPSRDLADFVRGELPLAAHLCAGFFQTVRSFEAASRQQESLAALGRLSAGLAHELNNPASAAVRSTDALVDANAALLDALVAMAEAALNPECFMELDALRRDAHERPEVDPTTAVELEGSLGDWLDEHGVADSWELAPTLAAAGVDRDWCEDVARVLPPPSLDPGIRWVAASLASSALLAEIKEATARISTLVNQARSYTQMDRAKAQTIDVVEGIESTLTVLGHKLPNDVEIVRNFDPSVPTIDARPAELNQVWTNLIDNALAAMRDGGGTLTLSTRMDRGEVAIDVADSGAGIPADVVPRIFDPFFTTKDVGEGTGLGLDISKRIVEGHRGRIEVRSVPGTTVFTVRLPVSGAV
jgi:signal transduction histidine kinase